MADDSEAVPAPAPEAEAAAAAPAAPTEAEAPAPAAAEAPPPPPPPAATEAAVPVPAVEAEAAAAPAAPAAPAAASETAPAAAAADSAATAPAATAPAATAPAAAAAAAPATAADTAADAAAATAPTTTTTASAESASAESASAESAPAVVKKRVAVSAGKTLTKKKGKKKAAGGKVLKKKGKKKKGGAVSSSGSDSDSGSSSSGSSSGSSSSSSSSSSDDDSSSNKKKKTKKKVLVRGGKKKGKKKKGKKGGLDSFIDNDGDNKDIIDEYNAQKEFDSDKDPMGDDESGQSSDGEDKDAPAVLDDEEDGSFTSVLNKIKDRSRRVKVDEGADKRDKQKKVQKVVRHMLRAYYADNEARSKRKPAVHKLKYLPKVMELLTRHDLQREFVDSGTGLRALFKWLSPNPVDKGLPAQSIRTSIISALPHVDLDDTDLEHSKLGRVVNFLSQHPKELQTNKVVLRSLMHDWSRRVFKKSSGNMAGRIRDAPGGDDDAKEGGGGGGSGKEDGSGGGGGSKAAAVAAAVAAKRALAAAAREAREGAQSQGFAELSKSRKERKRKAADPDDGRGSDRARIPQAMTMGFKFRPKDHTTLEDKDMKLLVRPSAKRIDLEKKILKKRRK